VVGIERGRWRVWKEERKGDGFWSEEFERVKVEEMKRVDVKGMKNMDLEEMERDEIDERKRSRWKGWKR
jgi:hypothetical protein